MTAIEKTKWWQAFNPAIYLISILPVVAILVLAANSPIWLSGLLFSTFAVVLLQHAINLFNDVSDWRLGADSEKMDSWVRVYDGNTQPVTLQAIASFIVGGLIGLSVLISADRLWILIIALPLISLGYLYNAGERPLSYSWMGEWVTAICYGPGVFGCLWLVAGLPINFTAIMGMLAFAALATSLLLSHQPPQIETDLRVGKKSFAVRYGVQRTHKVSILLFTVALLLIATGIVINHDVPVFQYVIFAMIVLFSFYLQKTKPQPKTVLLLSSVFLLFSMSYLL